MNNKNTNHCLSISNFTHPDLMEYVVVVVNA